MREKSTLREKNNVVAIQLLPLLEAEPTGWEAVTFFNLTKRAPENTLAGHLAEWSAAAPLAQRPFIAKLAATLGVKL